MNEKNKRVIPLQLHPHQSLGSLCLKDILKCTLYFRVIYTPLPLIIPRIPNTSAFQLHDYSCFFLLLLPTSN